MSAEAGRGWRVGVDAREEYRFRGSSQPGEKDNDLNLGLDLEASNPTGRLKANASLGLWRDLDGNPTGESFGLASMYDGRNPWVDVYQLSAEYEGSGALRNARVGRQSAEHGRPATFDGAALELRPHRMVSVFAFGGRTAHFFETGADLFEDWIGSVGVGVRPTSDLRLELDYRFMREAVEGLDSERIALQDHSYGATLWFRQGEWLRAKVFGRGLSGEAAEGGAQVRLFWPSQSAGLDARISAQPVSLRELSEEDNPFYLTLGRSLPHTRWRLDAWKALEADAFRLEAHLGYEGRKLLYDEETAFNRNSSRLYALLSLDHLSVLPGLSANVSLDRLSAQTSPFGGDGEWAIGGSLGYERGRIRAEAGTQYQRFRYVYYRSLEELADVRSYWGGVQVKATDLLSVRARYSAEVFDRTLHTFAITLVQGY